MQLSDDISFQKYMIIKCNKKFAAYFSLIDRCRLTNSERQAAACRKVLGKRCKS